MEYNPEVGTILLYLLVQVFCFPFVVKKSLVCWISIVFRDQRLHKLIFDESGLPDGTEVGYYACGQVELKIIKSFCVFISCFV